MCLWCHRDESARPRIWDNQHDEQLGFSKQIGKGSEREKRKKRRKGELKRYLRYIYFTFVAYKLYAIFFQFLRRKEIVTKGNEWISFGS